MRIPARIQLWLPRFFFALSLGLFALGGWMWLCDRATGSALHVAGPLRLGAIAANDDQDVAVVVTNTGAAALRLAGLQGESC